MGKNLVLISFKYGISSYSGIQFPLRYFYSHYFLLLDVYLMQTAKYEKTLLKCQLLCFFTMLDLIWPKFYSKDHTHFPVFLLISDETCLEIQLILMLIANLFCNPVVLKKIVKPWKNCFFGPICTKKGSLWATSKMKNNFFGQK